MLKYLNINKYLTETN